MNLELLDPFRRQIPDRVDATLNLQESLHFRHQKQKKDKGSGNQWKGATIAAFNRRGAYIAVGYGSGTIAVYDVLSRTLTGLYREDEPSVDDETAPANTGYPPRSNVLSQGITNVSWSRRSRTFVATENVASIFQSSHYERSFQEDTVSADERYRGQQRRFPNSKYKKNNLSNTHLRQGFH